MQEPNLSDADEVSGTVPLSRPPTAKRPKVAADLRAEVTLVWCYEPHSITLKARNWARVRKGLPLSIRGKGYYDEGRFYWDYWYFSGGLDGRLEVTYGSDGGTGFVGVLKQATIEEFA